MFGLKDDDLKRGKICYSLLKGKAADWYVSYYHKFCDKNNSCGDDKKWTADDILK